MIPNETPQNLTTVGEGVKVVGNFRITDETQARILVSLSDKMYTRKELAFVREYSTNAADAHLVVKKPISDIIVDLPTMDNLNFRIRDFGSGLTEEQIATVYCVFGESTKRNSKEQNGLLGYGCKAGFAHADSFTVTSWTNGEKSIYQCVKGDSSKLHSAILLSRIASEEPSGIEITIPVKQNSLWTVHREAADFYKHWPVVPTINNMADNYKERMESFRNNPPSLKGDGWEVRSKSDGNATSVAYMGWVAYNIDWNVLHNRMSLDSRKRVMFELLKNNDVTLFFKMGEVQFVDSRESLEYTDLTFKALVEKIEGIFNKIKDAIQEKFDPAPNIWEAKKTYNAIFSTGGLDVDKEDEDDKEPVQKIKILDGNLTQLEHTFKGLFTWKNIQLGDDKFTYVNKFDNDTPSQVHIDAHDPFLPVMVTYRRKWNRTRMLRCSSSTNNKITASERSVVVINDSGLKSGQSLVARYLIFGAGSKIRTVYVLTFADDTIKSNFYKEFSFESVPVLKFSELFPKAKQWNATYKTSRTYGGGGGGARSMKYMDLDSGDILETDVPIREIEDGGIYIECGMGRRASKKVRTNGGYGLENPETIARRIGSLVDKGGLDIDRVYIINYQVKEKKWFKAAVASGEWKYVWDYIKESLPTFNAVALLDSSNYSEDALLCHETAKKLKRKISDKKSPILKLINIVTATNYAENIELAETLKELGYWDELIHDKKGTVDFKNVAEVINEQYPFLSHYSHNLQSENNITDTVLENITRYINAMDLYVDLADEPKEKVTA